MKIAPEQTAIVFIGYQNDYFSADGVLSSALESRAQASLVVSNTVDMLINLSPTPVTFINVPIIFTEHYRELVSPVGILKFIKDRQAFKANSFGSATIDELCQFGDRIITLTGKCSLNAFSHTGLYDRLQELNICNVMFAGAVTSLCIDSSARHAADIGFNTYILADCTAGRTRVEQDFYCQSVFPLYATLTTSKGIISALT